MLDFPICPFPPTCDSAGRAAQGALQKHRVLPVHLLDLDGWKQWLSPFPTTSWQVRGPRELSLLLAVNGERCCSWASQAEVDCNFSFLNVSWTLMRNYPLT